jgi:hypothetical protein
MISRMIIFKGSGPFRQKWLSSRDLTEMFEYRALLMRSYRVPKKVKMNVKITADFSAGVLHGKVQE